jgi:hypothetical protein
MCPYQHTVLSAIVITLRFDTAFCAGTTARYQFNRYSPLADAFLSSSNIAL